MRHQTLDIASTLAAAAALVALALLPHGSSAEDLTSESFRLRGGTPSGGGAVGLESTAASPGIGFADATIGQSSPLGISSSDSGLQLASGFWPIVVPEPSALWQQGSAIGVLALFVGRRRRRRRPPTATARRSP